MLIPPSAGLPPARYDLLRLGPSCPHVGLLLSLAGQSADQRLIHYRRRNTRFSSLRTGCRSWMRAATRPGRHKAHFPAVQMARPTRLMHTSQRTRAAAIVGCGSGGILGVAAAWQQPLTQAPVAVQASARKKPMPMRIAKQYKTLFIVRSPRVKKSGGRQALYRENMRDLPRPRLVLFVNLRRVSDDLGTLGGSWSAAPCRNKRRDEFGYEL